MAFTVNQIYDRQYKNDKGKRSHTLTYLVVSDDPIATGEDAVTALYNATGFEIDSTYGTSGTTYLQTFESTCVSDDGKSWHVKADFGPPEVGSQNPLLAPYEYEWDMTSISRIVDVDVNGVPIVNTAGDFYNDPVEINDFLPTLSATGNHSTFNVGLAYAYRNAVNSDNWWGFPPGSLQVLSIKGQYINDAEWGGYWRSTYQLMVNPEGFDVQLASRGLRELDANGKLSPIKIKGKEITEPVMLDWNGKAMLSGGQPVIRKYQLYNRLPFNGVFAY